MVFEKQVLFVAAMRPVANDRVLDVRKMPSYLVCTTSDRSYLYQRITRSCKKLIGHSDFSVRKSFVMCKRLLRYPTLVNQSIADRSLISSIPRTLAIYFLWIRLSAKSCCMLALVSASSAKEGRPLWSLKMGIHKGCPCKPGKAGIFIF